MWRQAYRWARKSSQQKVKVHAALLFCNCRLMRPADKSGLCRLVCCRYTHTTSVDHPITLVCLDGEPLPCRTACQTGLQPCCLTKLLRQPKLNPAARRHQQLVLQPMMRWTGRMLQAGLQLAALAVALLLQRSMSCGRCWLLCLAWGQLQVLAWASYVLEWLPRRSSRLGQLHVGWRPSLQVGRHTKHR